MRKLKFYFIGVIPGLIFVMFILNKKGAKCTGYLPSSRVIAETLSKKIEYSDRFKNEMKTLHLSEKYLKDSIISVGEIDFDQSEAQKMPCPEYLLETPKSKIKYILRFVKCKDHVQMLHIKKIN